MQAEGGSSGNVAISGGSVICSASSLSGAVSSPRRLLSARSSSGSGGSGAPSAQPRAGRGGMAMAPASASGRRRVRRRISESPSVGASPGVASLAFASPPGAVSSVPRRGPAAPSPQVSPALRILRGLPASEALVPAEAVASDEDGDDHDDGPAGPTAAAGAAPGSIAETVLNGAAAQAGPIAAEVAVSEATAAATSLANMARSRGHTPRSSCAVAVGQGALPVAPVVRKGVASPARLALRRPRQAWLSGPLLLLAASLPPLPRCRRPPSAQRSELMDFCRAATRGAVQEAHVKREIGLSRAPLELTPSVALLRDVSLDLTLREPPRPPQDQLHHVARRSLHRSSADSGQGMPLRYDIGAADELKSAWGSDL